MEIPIQVAVRICPLENLETEPDDIVADTEEQSKEATAESAPTPPPPPTPDSNGNNKPEIAAPHTNDTSNNCCVQAIPITASFLGLLPSALPGGAALDSIAAGLIQVGPHTIPVTHALDSSTTQLQVYQQTVLPLISLFLEGFDASVVSYGQRGTGKTYTLYGKGTDQAEEGIVPRCVREIFAHVKAHPERKHTINVGYVEICNHEVCDLLGMGSRPCNTLEDVFRWLHLGRSRKSNAPTHTLFTLTLEQNWVSKDNLIQHRLSTASFSDLSGTERCGVVPPGQPRDLGLQMLEQLINILTDPSIAYGLNSNLPYAQNTLTTLLKDSFGGRAQTLVMLCVSPLEKDLAETLGNLQFAFKVQCVRNYVIMNTFSDDNTPVKQAQNNGPPVLMTGVNPLNADNFGLQFAASQWFKLVSNAEGLFAKLMSSNAVSELEKEQIEEWLFLKQECEECLSSNEALRSQKALVPIQEADEPEEANSDLETSCHQNSDNESDNESQNADLTEKLVSLMDEFLAKTDALIRSKHEEFMRTQPKAVMQSQDKEQQGQEKEQPAQEKQQQPQAEKCDERKASVGGRRRSIQPGASLSNAELAMLNRVASLQPATGKATAAGAAATAEALAELDPLESSTGTPDALRQAAINAPIEQLQKKLRKLLAEIEARQRQANEIEQTMQLKQNIITELVKNRDTRSHVKQRFNKKKAKLEAELEKAKKHLAKAVMQNKEKCEVERWNTIIAHLEQRLKDLTSMKHIAGESGHKLKQLQQSISESRKQLEELHKKLKKEYKQRDQVEAELKTLKEARVALVKVQDVQPDQLKAMQARITHLDHILREKSENLEVGVAGEESLRHEIRNLRRTRDHLLEQRCELDRKLKRDKMLTQREERKLLECDEAIEAIDAAIEFKNELICGTKSIDTSERLQREKGEQMLMARLNKLSLEEMRTLLYKYFVKVIDLRDSSRKLEQQLVLLERERDAWEWKERVLSNAVRQARLEGERNAVLLQRQHEMKLTLMMRHLAEETSTSSASYSERALAPATSSDYDYDLDFYKPGGSKALVKPPAKPSPAALEKYKDKERSGRNIFARFQVLTRYAAAAAAGSSHSGADESTALIETTTATAVTTTTNSVTTTAAASTGTGAKAKEKSLSIISPDHLRRLMPSTSSTKVTREKNKIIIQDATRNN